MTRLFASVLIGTLLALSAAGGGLWRGPLASRNLVSHALAAEKPAPPAKPSPAPGPADVSRGEADAEAAREEGGKSGGSSLPVPRFVSLRTDPINLRTGPGVRYPVEWVYVRRHLPVEVIGEYDTWRRIRDPSGSEGWVHQSMLSGRRTAIVTAADAVMRRDSNGSAAVIASLETGVIVNVQRCPADADFCRVEVNGIQGWLKRDAVWGVYPSETVQ